MCCVDEDKVKGKTATTKSVGNICFTKQLFYIAVTGVSQHVTRITTHSYTLSPTTQVSVYIMSVQIQIIYVTKTFTSRRSSHYTGTYDSGEKHTPPDCFYRIIQCGQNRNLSEHYVTVKMTLDIKYPLGLSDVY